MKIKKAWIAIVGVLTMALTAFLGARRDKKVKELKKVIKSIGEKCKVSIRNIRREANDELKKLLKSKEISEDDEKKFEKIIQDMTDNNIKLIDEKIASKEKEIMTI